MVPKEKIKSNLGDIEEHTGPPSDRGLVIIINPLAHDGAFCVVKAKRPWRTMARFASQSLKYSLKIKFSVELRQICKRHSVQSVSLWYEVPTV